jgi:hypothetical protein
MHLGTRGWVVVSLVFAAFLVVCGMLFWRPIAERYHMSRMLSAWQSVRRVGMSQEQSRFLETFEHHREALVLLGYFERMEFPLRHIGPARKEEWEALYVALNEEMCDLVEKGCFEMSGDEAETGSLIVIWARPQERQKYEKIVSRFDTASTRQ